MSSEHQARIAPHVTERRLLISAVITTLFVFAEASAGRASHSLALLSDAGHNFSDAVALVFSWYGVWISWRPASKKRTYGYHRVGIMAALFNAASLVAVALLIGWEAAVRIRTPQEAHGGVMIVVALIAIVMNGLIAFWLQHEAKHDLNVRSAYVHMLGDALSALGVVAAGIVVRVTGSTLADPIASIMIALLILWSSWGVLKESVNILLEASPLGVDMHALESAIESVSGVLKTHDLHVWTIGSGLVACSCHIVVMEQSVKSGQQVLRAVTAELEHRFQINHATIQVEVEGCEPDDMYCVMKAAQDTHRH